MRMQQHTNVPHATALVLIVQVPLTQTAPHVKTVIIYKTINVMNFVQTVLMKIK